MNKKFLAILVLLSVIPGCWWGPRYQCNRPCGEPRTTCVEATDCYQEEVQAPATTCYEDHSSTSCHEEYPTTTCYEDHSSSGSIKESDNVEYCYEAEDYPDFSEEAYPQEYKSSTGSEADQDFEEFDYEDDFDDYKD